MIVAVDRKRRASLKRGEKRAHVRWRAEERRRFTVEDLGGRLGSDARRALVVVRSGAGCGVTVARCSPELLASVRWRPHRDSNCTEPANPNPATTHAKAEFARESGAADRQERLDTA
jgi:hypothetical protein